MRKSGTKAERRESKKKKDPDVKQTVLPQNILQVGEQSDADTVVYISRTTYEEIHAFTEKKTVNESGGILVGHCISEFGKLNVVVTGFIEARHCEATPTTLTFTHKTWEHWHRELAKHEGEAIVGWIHTHPNFGIFLSEYDTFIHENFFRETHQIAYVVDPLQETEGFFCRIGGELKKQSGFFLYDEIGVPLRAEPDDADVGDKKAMSRIEMFSFVLILILAFVLVAHIVYTEYRLRNLSVALENVSRVLTMELLRSNAPVQPENAPGQQENAPAAPPADGESEQ
jgi:proteasome lid subunit RPN8/RPN11